MAQAPVTINSGRSAERAAAMQARLEWPMFVVAVLVIPAIVLTNTNVGAPWDTVGDILNWGTWLAFVAEFVAMLTVVPNRRKYVASHPVDVVIVFLTGPILTHVFNNLRLLRLLRVFRVMPLRRMTRWAFSADGVRYAALAALLVAVSAAWGYAQLQNTDVFTGFYWAITTMTTVGYGDLPVDGRNSETLAIVVMIIGSAFVAIMTGALAQRFLRGDRAMRVEADAEDVDMVARVDELSKQLDDLRTALVKRSVDHHGEGL